jgi:putative restriction endonuclease
MPEYIFGDINGVFEGDNFPDRIALREAKIHLVTVAGIDGNRNVGASSIVLNGGYKDDFDIGDEIIYTGHGGNDTNSKRQIADQSWEAIGNKALLVSEIHGLPIRVTRGAKHKSKHSPQTGYQYGGLYTIVDHFQEIGQDGFLICRYRLKKNSTNLHEDENPSSLLTNAKETKRSYVTILRIIRDTRISREIKDLYNYTCQVCGIMISLRDIKYAEAAHIKPLGQPHGGQDTKDNVICLCPNHHVMFDKGMFTIDSKLNLIGIDGYSKLSSKHQIDLSNLKYHREHVYIND